MPEFKPMSVQQPADFNPDALGHPSEMHEERSLAIPQYLEEEESRRPVWILLVQGHIPEEMKSMTASGAIRTDFSDVYAMGHLVLGRGSFAQVYIAHPRYQQQSRDMEEMTESRQKQLPTFHPLSQWASTACKE